MLANIGGRRPGRQRGAPLLRAVTGGNRLVTFRRASVVFLTGASVTQFASNAIAALVATIALGPAQRGVMVVGISVGSVVALVASMGTSGALRSRLPLAIDPDGRRSLVSAYTWWSLTASVLAAGFAVALSGLSALFVDPALSGGVFLVAVAIFTVGQVLLLQIVEAWYADGHFRRGGSSATAVAVGGLIGLLAAAAMSDAAAVLLMAQGIGTTVASVLCLGMLQKTNLLLLSRPRRRDISSLVSFGFPSLALVVGLAIALRADRYILGATGGVAAVGVYSLAATLSEIPRMVPQAMGQLFMRDTALGLGRDRLSRWLRLATAAAAAGGALVAVIGWFVIEPFFGSEFAGARQLLILLILAETCFAPYAVASRGLIGGGWTRTAGILGIGASIIAVVTYLIGSGLWGVIGLAVGSIAVYAALSLASSMLLYRKVAQ